MESHQHAQFRARIAISLVLLLLMPACKDDPYDPIIGPRRPGPGAQKYLATRSDLSEPEKQAVLDLRPCDPARLDSLAQSPSREVRSLVAANPSISPETMGKLLKDKEPGVRSYLALNPKTPRSILLQLRSDPDPNVSWGIARNPNWAPDDLRKFYLEKTDSPALIACNPSTPGDLLEELSGSKDHSVRTALANNPKISVGIVKKLLMEGNSATKKMLVDNPATPKEVVEALSKDSDPEVGRFAKEYLKRSH